MAGGDHDALADLLRGRRFVALTGAGCSTTSGIPDYRGPGTRERARNPVKYRAFVSDADARRRYWARSVAGWPRFVAARPNPAHVALAELERAGRLAGIITQNVDRLHQAAGSRRVVELHGALEEVRCLDCGGLEPRARLQERLTALNPEHDPGGATPAPDGDAELPAQDVDGFRVAPCERCGGVLKPHVVFFGENVPAPTVDAAYALLAGGDALVVAGSSLAVFSGYRFLRAAKQRGLPVAIVNLGPTRGEELADVRVEEDVTEALPWLASALI